VLAQRVQAESEVGSNATTAGAESKPMEEVTESKAVDYEDMPKLQQQLFCKRRMILFQLPTNTIQHINILIKP
jgi:hypothetical protein